MRHTFLKMRGLLLLKPLSYTWSKRIEILHRCPARYGYLNNDAKRESKAVFLPSSSIISFAYFVSLIFSQFSVLLKFWNDPNAASLSLLSLEMNICERREYVEILI